MNRLRSSLTSKVEAYLKRAIDTGNSNAAAEMERLRDEIEIVEAATNLCLYAAQVADYLIFNATRSEADIEPAAVQEADELLGVLGAYLAEINRLIDSGESVTGEAGTRVRDLLDETIRGTNLAIDLACDRIEGDCNGGLAYANTANDIEIDDFHVAIRDMAAVVLVALVTVVARFPLWILGGTRCQRRGPPRAQRCSHYARFVPVGITGPPHRPRMGALAGRVLIRGC